MADNYTLIGTGFYVFPSQDSNTVSLIRYSNGRDHLYTTDMNEIGVMTPGMVGKHGYSFESIVGYVYPKWAFIFIYYCINIISC